MNLLAAAFSPMSLCRRLYVLVSLVSETVYVCVRVRVRVRMHVYVCAGK